MESTNVAAERRDNKVLVYLANISTNQVKFDELGTEKIPKRFHTLFTKLKQDLTTCTDKGCPVRVRTPYGYPHITAYNNAAHTHQPPPLEK